jgi:glycosyltransferase involved in cell wall biosynthesis
MTNLASPTYSCSVVICAYTEKRWDQLVAAVESVRDQTVSPFEVIVVVDHNPSLLQRVRSELPDVVSVENPNVPGLSAARNGGRAVAQGQVVAFLDDDAIAEPNWLAGLTPGYADPNVIGVGGAILPMWAEEQPPWFPEEFNWVVGCTYRGMPVSRSSVRNLIGCNMSFRREVLEAVGGFRNGFGRIGSQPKGCECEETEFCIRTNRLLPQRVMLYEPSARVFHHVPPTRAGLRYFLARCYSEGIGKAALSKFVGAKDGLAAEWKYSLQTLPTGVARGLADTILGRDPSGVARAGAIMAGLTVTTAGYFVGRVAATPA